MDEALQASIAARLFAHIDGRSTDRGDDEMFLARAEYVTPERAERERERLIAAQPVLAGCSAELTDPGSFLTTRVLGTGALVVRQSDGSLRACQNVCRHRGATVTPARCGQTRSFSCPYHGWTYGLDGSLRGIPDREGSFPNIDPSEHGLVPLPVDERHGLVWMLPTSGAPLDVERYLGPEADQQLADLDLGSYALYRSETFEQPANWKLIMDGFLEVYHVRYLHPATVAPLVISNVLLVDRMGSHLRLVAARKDIEGLRPSGGQEPDIRPGIIVTYILTPATVLVYVRDHVELWSIVPHETDPGRCRITLRFLVPVAPATEREEAYWNRNWDIVVSAVRDEDWEAARRIQTNLVEDDKAPVVLGRNEVALQHFHRYVRNAVGE